jgi:hypothetical protein
VQTTEARRDRRFLFRELDGDLAREEIAAGQGHALEEFLQEQAVEEVLDGEQHDAS